ncbi:MAG: hypothetical protein RIN56_18830 [Sporomusaceae bacterium]|nr:hypothetical protein [Sporomusaceae bacterium]
MKKTVVTVITAIFLGVFAANIADLPMQTVYAAEQNSDEQPATAEKKDDGHSGHH